MLSEESELFESTSHKPKCFIKQERKDRGRAPPIIHQAHTQNDADKQKPRGGYSQSTFSYTRSHTDYDTFRYRSKKKKADKSVLGAAREPVCKSEAAVAAAVCVYSEEEKGK